MLGSTAHVGPSHELIRATSSWSSMLTTRLILSLLWQFPRPCQVLPSSFSWFLELHLSICLCLDLPIWPCPAPIVVFAQCGMNSRRASTASLPVKGGCQTRRPHGSGQSLRIAIRATSSSMLVEVFCCSLVFTTFSTNDPNRLRCRDRKAGNGCFRRSARFVPRPARQ